MTDMLTSTLGIVLAVCAVFILALYLLSVVWVIRDAKSRGTYTVLWGVVALIPVIGLIAYCVMRPNLYETDRDEQALDVALKQRELLKYGECAQCGYPVESDYVLCPNCHQRLKNLCPTCHHALNPDWDLCPYCTTNIRAGR